MRLSESDYRSVLDVLLAARDPETGEALSNEEARDQCGTMLAAGSETTARLLFWATYLLTLDQGQQDRLRAEIAAFEAAARLTSAAKHSDNQ